MTSTYRVSQKETSIFWDVISQGILSKNSISTYILFRTVSELFHRIVCKFVEKEILRIVSNIGIYCPNDKVGTVYPVQFIFENSSVNINALFSSCEDMAFCSSECILTFLCSGDNNHYEIEQFVSCMHFCSVHFTIHPTSLTRI